MGTINNLKRKTKNSKLLILHGWAYSTEKWKPFLKLLDQGGVKHEMLKIPGLTAPIERVLELNDYVSWLKRIANNQKPIAILGHSNGGRIAAAFTAKYPDKVSCLILIDSAGIINRNIKTRIKKLVFAAISKIGSPFKTQTALKTLMYKLVGEQDYNKASPILKKTMLNLISEDLEPVFSKIKAQTLIIWGTNDKTTPLSDGRRIHKLVIESRFEIIENAKHSPQFTHPKQVARIIIKQLHNAYI